MTEVHGLRGNSPQLQAGMARTAALTGIAALLVAAVGAALNES